VHHHQSLHHRVHVFITCEVHGRTHSGTSFHTHLHHRKVALPCRAQQGEGGREEKSSILNPVKHRRLHRHSLYFSHGRAGIWVCGPVCTACTPLHLCCCTVTAWTLPQQFSRYSVLSTAVHPSLPRPFLSPSILLSCTCCPCLVHCDSIANSSARPSACVCCSSIHSCSSRNTTSSPSLSINDVRLPQPPCRAQFSSPALSDPSHRHLSSRASICCSIVINRCSARRSIFMSLCGQLRSDAVTRRQNDLT
jgi:hypothetical protein